MDPGRDGSRIFKVEQAVPCLCCVMKMMMINYIFPPEVVPIGYLDIYFQIKNLRFSINLNKTNWNLLSKNDALNIKVAEVLKKDEIIMYLGENMWV